MRHIYQVQRTKIRDKVGLLVIRPWWGDKCTSWLFPKLSTRRGLFI
jgi:hypothetical protein